VNFGHLAKTPFLEFYCDFLPIIWDPLPRPFSQNSNSKKTVEKKFSKRSKKKFSTKIKK